MATFGLTAADVDTYAPGRGDFYSGDAVVAARVEVLIDRIGQEVLVKIRQQGWAIDEGDVTSDDELLSHAKAHVMYRVMAQLEAVASGQEASIVKFWMAEAEAAWGLLKTHTESLSEEYDLSLIHISEPTRPY